MTQTATVRRIVSSTKAEIAVLRASACGHTCADCGSCKMYEKPQIVAVAENSAGAETGDTVVVESATSRVLGIAAVVYLAPFLLFFALYLLAGALSISGGLALGFGGAGFAIGIAATVLLNRWVRDNGQMAFRIVSVKGR